MTVLVRPESVELSPDPAGAAHVVAASFLGAVGRVQVRLADGTLLLAQVPSGEVGRFGHGDPVRVMLKPVAALAVAA